MRLDERAAGAAVAVLLLALLTWLLIRGISTDATSYSATLRLFDEFALAEASLHRDVLEARAGLLQSYDPLNASMAQVNSVLAQLRLQAREAGLDAAPVNRLADATRTLEEQTERFKTGNALLRNSLSYVGLLSTNPDFVQRNPVLAPSIGALAAAVLQLTLDSSPQSRQTVQDRLVELTERTPAEELNEPSAQAFIAHARLLEDIVPTVDDTVKSLFAVPTRSSLEETRALFVNRHMAAEASAQRFRLLLYATSLLLVLALIDLGRRLRLRAVALRKRAAFEYLIARSSTGLINCPPGETGARVTQTLGELGKAMGVDRAYVALAEVPVRVYAWSADGSAFPSGWPERALALSEQIDEVEFGIVAVRNIASLPAGEAKTTLRTLGVQGWACVSLSMAGGARGILGFDTFRPAVDVFFPLAVVRLAGDAIGAAIERDLSERDRARLAARLERALRLQVVGQLASGIAHNFNNIIGAILGYSEMAATAIEEDTAKATQHLGEIQRAAERGRDLIDSILTFGRRSDARLVSAPALLEETASLVRATLPPGVALVVSDAPSDLAVFGETAQVQQIILNLCKNAVQAMDGSGRIGVMADAQELDQPRALSHGSLTPGRYVRFVVTDDGPGLSNEVARRIFEPFFTTRPAGTGLGLATVRKIVRDHDGGIHVASTPGQGSRFEAWLPAAAAGEGTAATIDETTPPRLGNGETVLIVDDERDHLLGHEETVAALGYEPVGFERSSDAIAAVRAQPGRFDAILISHGSVPAALALARSLHALAPRKPILLATRSVVDIGPDALVRAGIADLVRRPFAGADLAAALSRSLHSVATP